MTDESDNRLPTTAEQLREYAHALDLVPAVVRSLDGTVVIWTRAIERLYGWTAAEAVGRRVHDLLQTAFPAPLPAIEAELLAAG